MASGGAVPQGDDSRAMEEDEKKYSMRKHLVPEAFERVSRIVLSEYGFPEECQTFGGKNLFSLRNGATNPPVEMEYRKSESVDGNHISISAVDHVKSNGDVQYRTVLEMSVNPNGAPSGNTGRAVVRLLYDLRAGERVLAPSLLRKIEDYLEQVSKR